MNPKPALRLFALFALAACGGSSDPLAATLVADSSGGMFTSLRDAAPSSDGSKFYFVAATPAGAPAVFSVPAAGGAITTVAMGAPLVDPLGIAVGTDDKKLYIADDKAGIIVVTLDPKNSSPYMLELGSYGPTGIDVVAENGADWVYFVAIAQGVPQIMKVPANGSAAPMRLASRDPLTGPSGVAADGKGNAYVGNATVAGASGAGNLVKLAGTTATILSDKLTVGYPAGVALNLAGTSALVSGVLGGHAALYVVDLATGKFTTDANGIDGNAAAGGLHRAHNAAVYAWAGLRGGGAGAVYNVAYSP